VRTLLVIRASGAAIQGTVAPAPGLLHYVRNDVGGHGSWRVPYRMKRNIRRNNFSQSLRAREAGAAIQRTVAPAPEFLHYVRSDVGGLG
jgi:hypothetical protein